MADQAAPAAGDHRPLTLTLVVGPVAPGAGKSTIAGEIGAARLVLPARRRGRGGVLNRIGHGRHPIHRDMISPVISSDIAA